MRNLFKVFCFCLFSLVAGAQTVTIATSTSLFCTGKPITFSASTEASNLSYTWAVIPTKGLSSFTDLNSPAVTLNFSGTVTYSVFLNYIDNSGVTRVVLKTVTPGRSAVAAYNASLNAVGYPTQLVLTNYSNNSLRNYWTFSDSPTADSSYSLVKEYSKSGNYSVLLFAYGAKGCHDSTRYNFRISDSSGITLPNIFTPNGDGNNDAFTPTTRGISSLSAFVYNRTGIVVWSWDRPKGSWDGRSTSGEECPDGVYFITLEAMGFDGKSYKMKGTITLIR